MSGKLQVSSGKKKQGERGVLFLVAYGLWLAAGDGLAGHVPALFSTLWGVHSIGPRRRPPQHRPGCVFPFTASASSATLTPLFIRANAAHCR